MSVSRAESIRLDRLASHSPDGRAGTVSVRIMATSDLHMHILPYDYVSHQPSLTTGLARTAALIRAARDEAPNALLFDNGDFLHGSPLGDHILRVLSREVHGPRGRHPIVAAMARLGYDAITLGNHDFDHGIDYLGQVLATAPFPVVSSNLSILPASGTTGLGPAPAAVPFALLDRSVVDDIGRSHPLRIGVIGFMPPGSVTGLKGSRFRAEMRDIPATAAMMVPLLRGLGADLLIALAHSGIGSAADVPGLENAVVPLARLPGIDAIIAGHAHQVFPAGSAQWPEGVDAATGRIHGVPVVAPGFWGSHLGIIDLTLAQGPATSRWHVVAAAVEARPISRRDPGTGEIQPEVDPDPGLLRMLERLHRHTLQKARETVGETRCRLHSYFAAVAPSPSLDIVHRAMIWYARRALADIEPASLTILASTAPFKAGGLAGPGYYVDIPAGPVSRTALTDLYLFPNDLVVLRLSGQALVEWLERAASVFNRLEPGRPDQPLLSPATPLYEFETVAGIDYEIDLSGPARYDAAGALRDASASRIRRVTLGGAPLAPGQEVLLVTNTFRINGGGGYPVPGPDRIALDSGAGLRDILMDYLAATGPYTGAPLASWRFAPLPGTQARFTSSPRAGELADGIGGRGIAATGEIDADGFAVYRLTL